MNRILISRLLPVILCLLGCSPRTTYPVKQVKPLDSTSNTDAKRWKKARLLKAFQYPWRAGKPDPTRFRAVYDKHWFHFFFQVSESNFLQKTAILKQKTVLQSDRVELFFAADTTLNPYFALEIAPTGSIFGSKGRFYRKMEQDWHWSAKNLVYESGYDNEGYFVKGRIRMSFLENNGLISKDGKMRAGVFRVTYQTEANKWTPRWISWVNPCTPAPDFHISSAFGEFEFSNW